MLKPESFIMMPIPAESFTAVCALLGGAAAFAAIPNGGRSGDAPKPVSVDVSRGTGASSEPASETGANEQSGNGSTATTGASPSEDSGEVDAHGHPWSADLHASTKGKTKDGLWRMKVGVSRPDPKPGFPVDNGGAAPATGTSTETGTASATSQTATEPANAPVATSGPEEDDEFAAFRAAANASDQVDASAAAAAPTARQWSDADLGALCNQAAVKLGDPAPIKEIIGQYVPAGEVAHSRNIPADKREDFAKAVEAKAGIEFAG